MKQAGKARLIASVEMCLSTSGDVSNVVLRTSSGYAEYDEKLKAVIRRWRYGPYLVAGKPLPICTNITFLFSPSL